ncbi:MAG: DUF6036 family nucleotidyltransferase [Bacteroidota bacterium]
MILELLQKTCEKLEHRGINYMLSGSIAMGCYAIPRTTRDIDIVIELDETAVDEFLSLFENCYFNKDGIIKEIKRKRMFNIIDNESGFKMDFIIRKDSVYAHLAFKRRVHYNEFGFSVWIITLEDLIIAKLIWIQKLFSEMQFNDIKNLLLNPDINFEYLTKWCSELRLNTFNLIEK